MVGWSVQPFGAKQPGFLPFVRDEEDRARRLLRRELLGNLQENDGARSIVVGPVHDRVAAHRPDASRTGDERVNAMLLLRRGTAHRIVVALTPRHRIEGAERIMVDGREIDTVVIVVCAHEHVLGGARGIGAG